MINDVIMPWAHGLLEYIVVCKLEANYTLLCVKVIDLYKLKDTCRSTIGERVKEKRAVERARETERERERERKKEEREKMEGKERGER